jgi:hypothetical protein
MLGWHWEQILDDAGLAYELRGQDAVQALYDELLRVDADVEEFGIDLYGLGFQLHGVGVDLSDWDFKPFVPSWFQPLLINVQLGQPNRLEPQPESSENAYRYLEDVLALRLHFVEVCGVYSKMNSEFSELPQSASDRLPLLESMEASSLAAISEVLSILPEFLNIDSEQSIATFLRQLRETEPVLECIRELLHESEKYFAERERCILNANDSTFAAYASRYERTRLRCKFKQRLAGLVTPQLRNANWENGILARVQAGGELPVSDQHNLGDNNMCFICHDELDENSPALVTTHSCCLKPFHANCLLGWLLDDFSHEAGLQKDCPHCRAKVNLKFLGQVLEVKTKELDVL